MTTFSAKLKPLVEAHGTTAAARICGVTPRTLQLWMRGATPCAAMQAGVVYLLKPHGRSAKNASA